MKTQLLFSFFLLTFTLNAEIGQSGEKGSKTWYPLKLGFFWSIWQMVSEVVDMQTTKNIKWVKKTRVSGLWKCNNWER